MPAAATTATGPSATTDGDPLLSANERHVCEALRGSAAAAFLAPRHRARLAALCEPFGVERVTRFAREAAQASPVPRGNGFVGYVETCLGNEQGEQAVRSRRPARQPERPSPDRTVVHE